MHDIWLKLVVQFVPIFFRCAMAARTIKARLGSVRMVLSGLDGTHAYHSSLQRKVVEDMVKASQLTAEEKAEVASVVSSVGFTVVDEQLLLAALNADSSGKVVRRKQQDFQSFIQYLAGDDWRDLIACKNNIDNAIDIVSNVLILRFGCINPCEFTLRRIASLAMCVSYEDTMSLPVNDKKSALKSTKARFFKRKRAFLAACKKVPSMALPYIEELPNSPNVFELRVDPSTLERCKIKDCWISPQVRLQDIYNLETTFNCRGDPPMTTMAIASPTMANQSQMQMFLQMFQMMQNGIQNPNGINLTFPSSRKRGLREIMGDDAGSQADAMQHRRCKTVLDFDGVPGNQQPMESPNPMKALEGPKPFVLENGVVGVATESAPRNDVVVVDTPPDGEVGKLFEALMERDRDKQKARAEEAKSKKLQAATDKKLQDAVDKQVATPPKKVGSKAGTPSKLLPKAATPSKMGSTGVKSEGAASKKRVGVDHEGSRQQYLARSQNNGSKSFKYGKDANGNWHPYKTAAAAMAAAKSWLNNHP
jgi:hypothetical protein